MKHLILLAALPCALLAQSMEGTWQGTLMPPNSTDGIRLAFRIERDGSSYKGKFYNLANKRQFDLGTVTLRENAVSITIPGNGMTYEGKLDAEGNSIGGTLNPEKNPLPLPLKRATASSAWELPAPDGPPGVTIPKGGTLEFEVASIRPSSDNRPGNGGFNVTATELVSRNTSLADIATFAYEIHAAQLQGLPAWATSEKYDIVARLPSGGEPTDAQIHTMLQNLLKRRFSFAAHKEKRELPVYVISLGKEGAAGIKMTKNTTNGTRVGSQGLGRMTASGMTMAGFAGQMQFRVLDRPVLDQTGLTDRYDFALNWQPDDFQFPSFAAVQREYWASKAKADGLADLFTAFQEQLGLKLTAAKASADVLVIDAVSKPSAN